MIEAIRDYFADCPFLEPDALLNIDYIAEHKVTYSLNVDPTHPVLKQYTDGTKVKCVNFSFNTVTYYGENAEDNKNNLSFYEKLEEWIEKNNENYKLPLLNGTKTAQKIEILTSGYLLNNNSDTGQYIIQLRLIYTED